ncbi:putative secreted protein (Por secretion system target) [Gelidibacter sediminis]|uniref:Putative secreted protein (Por secretion system target) n=1 Tax=Gelidibacter sediminis TaxID=1608710 RepID=A0A4R7PZV8_9FLAO|nr:T9SS type A sorting domain-containing protein [Gelidibacter sediminis]TDU40597.1 putative secreted protein (Por secretion system target) [Gelidibacter sediminis]
MKTTLHNFTFFIILTLCIIPFSNAQSWEYVGTPGFSGGGVDYTSFALNSTDEPYVAFLDSLHLNKVSVMKFNGTNWEAVGARGFSTNQADFCSLAINDSGEPYVAFQDRSFLANQATVMKFDGTNWVNVGSPGFSAGGAFSVSLALSNSGVPYVAYRDHGNLTKLTVMKFNGANWENVGSPGFSDGQVTDVSLKLNASGVLYVAFKDYGGAYSERERITVMKFNGSNWETVGMPRFSNDEADYCTLAFSNTDEPYVAFTDKANQFKATVMKFNGSNWETVGLAGFSPDRAFNFSLTFSSVGVPYLAYMDRDNEDKATVVKFNGTNWETVGSHGFSEGRAFHSSLLLNSSDEPYLAISETSLIGLSYRRASVMKFTNTMSVQDNEVSRVSLYPNPANDLVTLTNLPYGETDIKVFDITGKEVFSINANTGIETIDTTNFTNGIYLVRIGHKEKITYKKLVISNKA